MTEDRNTDKFFFRFDSQCGVGYIMYRKDTTSPYAFITSWANHNGTWGYVIDKKEVDCMEKEDRNTYTDLFFRMWENIRVSVNDQRRPK